MYRLAALLVCVLISGWGFCDDAKPKIDPKLGQALEELMHKASDRPLQVTAKRYVPQKGTLGLAIASCEYIRPDRPKYDPDQDGFAGFVVTDNGIPVVTLDPLPFCRNRDYPHDMDYIPYDMSAGQLTLNAPEQYESWYVSRIKLFFNLKNKKNLGHREYLMPFVTVLTVKGNTAWCAMNAWTMMDEKREPVGCFIAKIRLDTDDCKPELLTQVNGAPIADLRESRVTNDGVVFSGERGDLVLTGDTWNWRPRATLKVQATPPRRNPETGLHGDIPPTEPRAFEGLPKGYTATIGSQGVAVVSDSGGIESYPVEEITQEFLYKMRPDLQTDRSRGNAEYFPNNGIGGWAAEGDHVVFGAYFYSDEGEEGVGAIGYFDFRTRKYRYEYPEILARWSTPTLLLDGDTLWMGLVDYGEGSSWSGGLLRYNRKDKSHRIYDIPANIVQIVKARDRLLIATIDGLYILRNDKLTRIQGTVNVNGKPYLDVRPSPNRPSPEMREELRVSAWSIDGDYGH